MMHSLIESGVGRRLCHSPTDKEHNECERAPFALLSTSWHILSTISFLCPMICEFVRSSFMPSGKNNKTAVLLSFSLHIPRILFDSFFDRANLQCSMDNHLTSLLRLLSSVFVVLFCAYRFSCLSLSHLAKKDANNRPQRERQIGIEQHSFTRADNLVCARAGESLLSPLINCTSRLQTKLKLE
jgi:hypothetical protein